MKSVGSHPNLVSIIGCCTRRETRRVMLVVEYCALGDLQNYLRSAWDHLISQPRYTNIAEDIRCNLVVNKLYEMNEKDILQASDLLSFARQIAIGMVGIFTYIFLICTCFGNKNLSSIFIFYSKTILLLYSVSIIQIVKIVDFRNFFPI